MATTDKRVEAYIAKAAPFAQPILRELRAIVHEGCPDVVETIKWGFPNFDYKGILCNMAAFKQHCSFGFWKSSLGCRREKHQIGGRAWADGQADFGQGSASAQGFAELCAQGGQAK